MRVITFTYEAITLGALDRSLLLSISTTFEPLLSRATEANNTLSEIFWFEVEVVSIIFF